MASDSSKRLLLSSSAGKEVITTLASDTARDVYQNLHENPEPPAEVADELELTVQTVRYHIRNLKDVELVQGVDTRYSEKGVEMTVYKAIPIEVVCPGSDSDDGSESTNLA